MDLMLPRSVPHGDLGAVYGGGGNSASLLNRWMIRIAGHGSPRTVFGTLPRARRSGGGGGALHTGDTAEIGPAISIRVTGDPGELAPPAMTVSDRGRGCR